MTGKELKQDIIDAYKTKNPKSFKLFEENAEFLIKGGSHNARLMSPFPIYDLHCSGSRMKDVDGNSYIDFWQGHFTNIFIQYMQNGSGLQTGFAGIYHGELAKLILKCLGAERIRFTTSGTLASMYAIMLARAFTNRDIVLKVGCGRHGSHPFA